MTEVTKKIRIDLANQGGLDFLSTIHAVQGDAYSRLVAFELYNGGEKYTPPKGTTAIVRYRKEDGTRGNYDVLPDGSSAYTIEGNMLTVALAPQLCIVPGLVQLAVGLISGNAEINTFSVRLVVQPNPGITYQSESHLKLAGTVADSGWEPNMYLGTDDGGNVTGLSTDKTLNQPGRAADAKSTGDAVGQLKENIDNIVNGVKPVHKDIVWQDGYIDNNGIVKKSTISKYAVISLKSNETVYIGTTNVNITMLGKTNSDTVSVGDTVTPIKITSAYEHFEDYTYYTLEDVNIVVCVLASNYKLKFYEKPFFLNEDTKVFHVTDYVNGGYYNTGLLNNLTNRVRTSNFLILNKGEAVDAKNIPYGYELNISFFDFNTKKLKYGDEWGGLYPYVAQEKILMLPVWRRSDNTDLSPSEITGDVVIYGTCLSDIKYNDSVIASNLGIQDKINQANHYRRNNTKPLCLAHISDLHLDKIRLQRFTNFISNIKNIDDAICTGDMVDKYADGMAYWDSVNDSKRILTCIGNHDGLFDYSGTYDWYTSQCTMAQAYERFFEPYISNWGVTYQKGKTYYYKDYETEKIRIIVLDSMRSGEDVTNQNDWLSSTLLDAKTKGYSVICAAHCVPETSKVNYINCTFNSINLKYEDEYDTCVTNAIYQKTVQNFIDDGGKFITWICGHTHVDFVYTTSEFPNQLWIVVACGSLSNDLDIDRTDGTKNQDTFNILTFDTNIELVKVIRVGADRDRSMRHLGTMSIDYNTHNVIYND